MGLKQDLKKLYDDLDYWIYIGIGDDIVKARDQRPEYKPLVAIAQERGIVDVPRFVRLLLFIQIKKPVLLSITGRYLLWKRLLKYVAKLKNILTLRILNRSKEN